MKKIAIPSLLAFGLLAATLLLRALPAAHAAPTLPDTIDLSPGEDAYNATQFAFNGNTHKLYVLGYARRRQRRPALWPQGD